MGCISSKEATEQQQHTQGVDTAKRNARKQKRREKRSAAGAGAEVESSAVSRRRVSFAGIVHDGGGPEKSKPRSVKSEISNEVRGLCTG